MIRKAVETVFEVSYNTPSNNEYSDESNDSNDDSTYPQSLNKYKIKTLKLYSQQNLVFLCDWKPKVFSCKSLTLAYESFSPAITQL